MITAHCRECGKGLVAVLDPENDRRIVGCKNLNCPNSIESNYKDVTQDENPKLEGAKKAERF